MELKKFENLMRRYFEHVSVVPGISHSDIEGWCFIGGGQDAYRIVLPLCSEDNGGNRLSGCAIEVTYYVGNREKEKMDIPLVTGDLDEVEWTLGNLVKMLGMECGNKDVRISSREMLPAFDWSGGVSPHSIIYQVKRDRVEEIEIGEGLFFDGKWENSPYVTVKTENGGYQTVKFRTFQQAEEFYSYITSIDENREG